MRKRTRPTLRVGKMNSGTVASPTSANFQFMANSANSVVDSISALFTAFTAVVRNTSWMPSMSLFMRVVTSPGRDDAKNDVGMNAKWRNIWFFIVTVIFLLI